jgi:hypothetical protein
MDEAQQTQIVDLLRQAQYELEVLGEKLPKSDDDDGIARRAYDRAISAVHAALSILDS